MKANKEATTRIRGLESVARAERLYRAGSTDIECRGSEEVC